MGIDNFVIILGQGTMLVSGSGNNDPFLNVALAMVNRNHWQAVVPNVPAEFASDLPFNLPANFPANLPADLPKVLVPAVLPAGRARRRACDAGRHSRDGARRVRGQVAEEEGEDDSEEDGCV